MADKTLKSAIKDVADAIREKTGKNGLMRIEEMPDEIGSIEGDNPLTEGDGLYSLYREEVTFETDTANTVAYIDQAYTITPVELKDETYYWHGSFGEFTEAEVIEKPDSEGAYVFYYGALTNAELEQENTYLWHGAEGGFTKVEVPTSDGVYCIYHGAAFEQDVDQGYTYIFQGEEAGFEYVDIPTSEGIYSFYNGDWRDEECSEGSAYYCHDVSLYSIDWWDSFVNLEVDGSTTAEWDGKVYTITRTE